MGMLIKRIFSKDYINRYYLAYYSFGFLILMGFIIIVFLSRVIALYGLLMDLINFILYCVIHHNG